MWFLRKEAILVVIVFHSNSIPKCCLELSLVTNCSQDYLVLTAVHNSTTYLLKRGVGKLVINEGHPVRMGKNGDLDIQFGYLHFVLISHN